MEDAGVAFLCFVVIFAIGFFLVVALQQQNMIQIRIPLYVFFSTLSSLILSLDYLSRVLSYYLPADDLQIPCPIHLCLSSLLIPLWTVNFLIRCAHFIQEFQGQQINLLEIQRSRSKIVMNDIEDLRWYPRLQQAADQVVDYFIDILNMFERFHSGATEYRQRVQSTPDMLTVKTYKRFTRWSAILLLAGLGVTLVLLIVIQFGVMEVVQGFPFSSIGCHTTASFWPEYYIICCWIPFACLILAIFTLAINQCRDEMGICKELNISASLFIPLFLIYLFQIILDPSAVYVVGIAPDLWGFLVFFGCFIASAFLPIFYWLHERLGHVQFEYSRHHFEQVLSNKKLLAHLRDLAAKELCVENILFIQDYHDLLKKKTIEASEIKAIYQTYFAKDSPRELNLPYTIHSELDDKTNRDLTFIDFTNAYKHVLDLVYSNTFRHYCGKNKNG